jgi:hypothetical protein
MSPSFGGKTRGPLLSTSSSAYLRRSVFGKVSGASIAISDGLLETVPSRISVGVEKVCFQPFAF